MSEIEKKTGEIVRLMQFLAHEELQVDVFAGKIDVSERTIKNSIYDNKPLGLKVLRGFADLGGSVDWLLTGKGTMYGGLHAEELNQQLDRVAEDSAHYGDSEFQSIKLYKSPASAGHGNTVDSEDFKLLFFRKEWFQARGLIANNLVAVNVPGDSQEPDIPAGSVVLIDITDTDVKNENFYVFNVDGDLLIKEMHLTFDGYIAKSKNKAAGYDDIVLTKEKINTLNIIGRAVRALPDFAL